MYKFSKIYSTYNKLTESFFLDKKIDDIKIKSQYFTPILEAEKLVEDVEIVNSEEISILDPACGNGILILKLLEKIFIMYEPKIISIDVYDIDNDALNNFKYIISLLKGNKTKIIVNYFNNDFVTSYNCKKYDYIVMNPPYKKINVTDVPKELENYLNGQPNLYHLFIAKALDNLSNNGILCIISPKNYLSGRYTEKIRKKIVDNFSIIKIHTFNDRRNIFRNRITQEVCIVNISRIKKENVLVAYNNYPKFIVRFDNLLLNKENNIILTPRSLSDYELIRRFRKFPVRTIGMELIINVGKVVQFRVKSKDINLKNTEYFNFKNGIPLIVYRHIKGEKLDYKILTDKRENNAITMLDDKTNSSLIIDNNNYVLIRKNIDKKYDKLIHCIGYYKDLSCDRIAIDNSIIYISRNKKLVKNEVKGLQCILMSRQFDDYYRMINSSHTINVYELENMHFPDIDTIRLIGKKVGMKTITIKLATEIFEQFL